MLTMRDGSTATNFQPQGEHKGKLFGEGKVTVGDTKYEGEWDASGMLNGKGKIFSVEKSFVKNKEVTTDTLRFDGRFVDGKRNGEGIYTWPDCQDEYQGLFRDDKRHTGPDGEDAQMIWGTGD